MLTPFCFASERLLSPVSLRGREAARGCTLARSSSRSRRSRISRLEPAVHPARPPSGFPAGRREVRRQGRASHILCLCLSSRFLRGHGQWAAGLTPGRAPCNLSHRPERVVPSASDFSLPDAFQRHRCQGRRLGRVASPSPAVPATPGRAPAGPAQSFPRVSAPESLCAESQRASWSQADCSCAPDSCVSPQVLRRGRAVEWVWRCVCTPALVHLTGSGLPGAWHQGCGPCSWGFPFHDKLLGPSRNVQFPPRLRQTKHCGQPELGSAQPPGTIPSGLTL